MADNKTASVTRALPRSGRNCLEARLMAIKLCLKAVVSFERYEGF